METKRLLLINGDLAILEKLIEGNQPLAEYLKVNVPENWSEHGAPIFQYSLERLSKHPDEQPWLTWLPVIKDSRTLIGSCGYKGLPDEHGIVEIGYEISENQRNQGYATELAVALVQHAFGFPTINNVLAHTLAEENPSVKVLRKIGFVKVGEIEDPEDGLLWKWLLPRT